MRLQQHQNFPIQTFGNRIDSRQHQYLLSRNLATAVLDDTQCLRSHLSLSLSPCLSLEDQFCLASDAGFLFPRKTPSSTTTATRPILRCQARKVLPSAAFVLKSQREATDIALELNATVDMFSGATARWAAAELLKERGEVVLSPADRVR